MKNHIKISLLISSLLACSILLTACGAGQSVNETQASADASDTIAVTNTASPSIDTNNFTSSRNTITVNSSETVSVTPDIAQIVYGVRTEAKDASTCQQNNTADVNKVTELLKSLGVAESSIQTTDYYMYPIYNYSGNTRRITGYEATTSLTVSDLPIDNLGNILAQSVDSGINNIQSITYQSSKYDEGYTKALTLAVGSARTKAEALAEAGGCTLGSVAGIRENSNYSEARYTDYALSAKMNAREEASANIFDASADIMPGEVDIVVNITVEYFIQ